MPTLKTKDGEITISAEEVAAAAHRMYKLGGEGRRENYIEKARKRLEAGPCRRGDVAIVLAAGG